MRRLLSVVAAVALVCGVGAGTAAAASASQSHRGGLVGDAAPYLVVLRQAPAASYQGGIPGYPATRPKPGERFDDSRGAVGRYRLYLLQRQRQLRASVDVATVLYSYTTALDGFAALLTPQQVKALETTPGVLLVQPDETLQVDAAATTDAATAPANEPPPTRLWRGVGGPQRAGLGEVIGIVDTGVDPGNPSLAGIPVTREALARRYPGFTGACELGAHWSPTACDSKVVAARWFVRGFGRADVATSDYLSARDSSGHGTSVAGIAAGNSGIDTEIAGQSFGHISGVAPAAGISVYKACWTAPDPAHDGCDLADVVAAVDSAVRDGVDVISCSVSGTQRGLRDAVEIAFLNAAAANVFVATAAGNDGPRPGSVDHPSPWATTVGANTADVYQGGVRLGDGSTYVGDMLSDRTVGPTRLVYGGDVPAPGVAPRRAALCFPGSLDAQHVEGAIVVCDRGVTARVSKSGAVAQSGGVGMVLVNTRRQSVDADVHAVPTVHLPEQAGRAVEAYVARAGRSARATLVPGATDHPAAPVVAGFSGRGPAVVSGGAEVKPDLTAPGVSVVAPTSTAVRPAQRWDVESGTSIATPHVAGVAAVLRAARPAWSPAVVKSALTTTAGPLEGSNDALSRGAGELDAGAALRPGLAFDNGLTGWRRLLRGQVDPSRLNTASVAVADLVAKTTVRRTVTNVGDSTDTYTAAVQGLRGVSVSVVPSTLTLAPGQRAAFRVTFTAGRHASYDSFAAGDLVWRDSSGRAVTVPMVVRPELATVPAEVSGSGRNGSLEIRALAGVTGTVRASSSGLVGAAPVALSLRPRPFDPTNPSTSAGTAMQTLTVPVGARAARFQVDSRRGQDADVDLYVYRGDRLVGAKTNAAAGETLTLDAPQPGRYRVFVNAHRAAAGSAVRATLTSWVLPHRAPAELAIAPRRTGVDGGQPFGLVASWSGLSPRERWWGIVSYDGLPTVTYVTVD